MADTGTGYRSREEYDVFVLSDQHLLVFNAAAERRLCYLDTVRARHVVFNGDTIDEDRAGLHCVRALSGQDRDWFNAFFALKARTERVTVLGGNHDENLDLAKKITFTDALGRSTVIVHGDDFDAGPTRLDSFAGARAIRRFTVAMGDHIHTGIIALSALADKALYKAARIRFNPFGAWMRVWDTLRLETARFESRNYDYAVAHGHDVVVTGHTHLPGIKQIRKGDLRLAFARGAALPRLARAEKDVLLVNAGDGVENFSGAGLTKAGDWVIRYYHDYAPEVGPVPEGLREENRRRHGHQTDALEAELRVVLPVSGGRRAALPALQAR